MTTVLVCGGRDYANRKFLFDVLDKHHRQFKYTLLVHGGAKGADTLAGEWAKARGVSVQEFPADWVKDGKAAGPLRNSRMLAEAQPKYVVAFPGGKGTADMIKKAHKAKCVQVVYQPAPLDRPNIRNHRFFPSTED